MGGRDKILDAFINLGGMLADLQSFPAGRDAVRDACEANPWFTPREVCSAGSAIAGRMLDRDELYRWAARYTFSSRPKDVLLVMAGNIPFAGFFDMLCILASGHRCIAKYSSKDTVLMHTVARELKKRYPAIPIAVAEEHNRPDAVIASGSDNAVRHLKSRYGKTPSLLRGNRASVAILTGSETRQDIDGLARDIFTYNGLGCRNVSHLYLPVGYDVEKLARLLSTYPADAINPGYVNNFRQRSAVLEISGREYTRGNFFVMSPSEEFPTAISEITYSYYGAAEQAAARVAANENRIQCVVAGRQWKALLPFGCVPFGQAQSPTLYDFADRIDTMLFLAGID